MPELPLDRAAFGARVRTARKTLGWSQNELARRAGRGLTNSLISRVEVGLAERLTHVLQEALEERVVLLLAAGRADAAAEAASALAALGDNPAGVAGHGASESLTVPATEVLAKEVPACLGPPRWAPPPC